LIFFLNPLPTSVFQIDDCCGGLPGSGFSGDSAMADEGKDAEKMTRIKAQKNRKRYELS